MTVKSGIIDFTTPKYIRVTAGVSVIQKISKHSKTKEDVINEAKLALEAKALTTKAVIAELEKINNMPTPKDKGSSTMKQYSSSNKTLKSSSPTSYLSRLLTKRKKTAKNNKKINKNNNNMTEKKLLFIQNEFTPSNMTISLTDEKLYKK